MKQFRIKQKMWSLGGSFDIQDENGQLAYQVEGSFFKIPKSFTIYDPKGQVISRIEKQFFTFLPKFDVQLAGGQPFTIRKEFTFFKPRYQIDNLGLTIQGDFWDMNFDLLQNGRVVAQISQEWLRLTSTYNITVFDDSLADLVLSLVIAIDYVKEQEAAASAASSQ
ncbi:LURP-one-related/scramblase family protein [Streptococcus cameli]